MNLYLASGNVHKAQEFQALAHASDLPLKIISAQAVGGMPAVAEDTGTFIGNARKKALALKAKLPPEAWVLADDSGLCVDALGGAPGVESAYFAGPEGDSAANLGKLAEDMRDVPAGERGAHFVCVLILIDDKNNESVFEGKCEGTLASTPRGRAGFGYDPFFIPFGHEKSLAELGEASKNQLSHRAKAAAELMEWLRSHQGA